MVGSHVFARAGYTFERVAVLNDNLVIWFIGANAAGKTTQAALLHKYFRDVFDEGKQHLNKYVKEERNGTLVSYTVLSPVSTNVGKFNHPITSVVEDNTTATCGTDTINKKEQIIASFEAALAETPIVIMEGVMATGTWIDFLKRKGVELVLIHMEMDTEDTLARLLARRAEKTGKTELEMFEQLQEKTIKNIDGKVRGFRSMYKKLSPLADYAFSVDATKDANWIHYDILNKIKQVL